MGINNSKYWNEALETQSRDELEAQQLKDLKEIVQFAYDNAPYYYAEKSKMLKYAFLAT